MPSLPIIVIAVGLICYTLTCWALIDVAQRRFSSIVEKAIWAGVAFFPFYRLADLPAFRQASGVVPPAAGW